MRARPLVQALVAGALLVVAMSPPVEAQRGLGKGRGAGKEQQTPKEELGPGEYPFEGFLVLEAVNRGEGPQALAYYEKTAQEALKQGDQLRAARALGAATTVAQRLGRYQKSIQYGTRSLELYKSAKDPAQSDLMAWAAVHAQLGSAYRAVGDQTRARQVLEDGLQFANTRLSGRREGQVEG